MKFIKLTLASIQCLWAINSFAIGFANNDTCVDPENIISFNNTSITVLINDEEKEVFADSTLASKQIKNFQRDYRRACRVYNSFEVIEAICWEKTRSYDHANYFSCRIKSHPFTGNGIEVVSDPGNEK